MASLFIKLLLFGSSYAPLALIFTLLYWVDHPRLAIWCVCMGLLCFVVLVLYVEVRAPLRSDFTKTIAKLQRRDGDVLSYIATYLIPFVTLPFTDNWQEVLAILTLLGVIAFVYINSNMLYVNPTLLALGYHPYEISFDGDESAYIVLARGRIRVGDVARCVDIADDVFLRVPSRSKG